jgi:hypothetical protein
MKKINKFRIGCILLTGMLVGGKYISEYLIVDHKKHEIKNCERALKVLDKGIFDDEAEPGEIEDSHETIQNKLEDSKKALAEIYKSNWFIKK